MHAYCIALTYISTRNGNRTEPEPNKNSKANTTLRTRTEPNPVAWVLKNFL